MHQTRDALRSARDAACSHEGAQVKKGVEGIVERASAGIDEVDGIVGVRKNGTEPERRGTGESICIASNGALAGSAGLQ